MQFEAARLLLNQYGTNEGRRAVGQLHPRVVDGITRYAEFESARKSHNEIIHLNATLVRLLGDSMLGKSETLREQLTNSYRRAEELTYPAKLAHREVSHALIGVTKSIDLQTMHEEQLEALDDLARTSDETAVSLHRELLTKFKIALKASDANRTKKIGQAYEVFSEFWVYRRLRDCMTLSKIPEQATPTPDFRCQLGGRDFFIEVKAPDIAGGELHHAELLEQATDGQIDLEAQHKAGKHVAITTSEIAPFQSPSDKSYSGSDFTYAIRTIRDRSRTLFKTKQFSAGPTFALMVLDRYPIPGRRRAILPEYHVGGMYSGLPDDRQSGVLWQAAFGADGTQIHNVDSAKRTLTGVPFMRDPHSPFPGVGFLTLQTFHHDVPAGKAECWGLLARDADRPTGWLITDTEAVLNAVCDVWNDGEDTRPRWVDD